MGTEKKKKTNLAMSVVPGQFLGGKNNKMTGKNLAQSVGFGLLQDINQISSRQTLNPKTGQGILAQFADDVNLPDDIEDESEAREAFHEGKACELCEKTFNKIKGIGRHHCRKCYKSVCQQCSSQKRKLAKNIDTLFRVCDYCDTQLSNYKLEQNQVTILKAQQEQMQMYMEQLQYLDSQKDAEQKKNQENQAKLQDFLQREVEKKNKLDAEVKKLEDRTLALNQTRNDLFKQLNGMEKTIEEK